MFLHFSKKNIFFIVLISKSTEHMYAKNLPIAPAKYNIFHWNITPKRHKNKFKEYTLCALACGSIFYQSTKNYTKSTKLMKYSCRLPLAAISLSIGLFFSFITLKGNFAFCRARFIDRTITPLTLWQDDTHLLYPCLRKLLFKNHHISAQQLKNTISIAKEEYESRLTTVKKVIKKKLYTKERIKEKQATLIAVSLYLKEKALPIIQNMYNNAEEIITLIKTPPFKPYFDNFTNAQNTTVHSLHVHLHAQTANIFQPLIPLIFDKKNFPHIHENTNKNISTEVIQYIPYWNETPIPQTLIFLSKKITFPLFNKFGASDNEPSLNNKAEDIAFCCYEAKKGLTEIKERLRLFKAPHALSKINVNEKFADFSYRPDYHNSKLSTSDKEKNNAIMQNLTSAYHFNLFIKLSLPIGGDLFFQKYEFVSSEKVLEIKVSNEAKFYFLAGAFEKKKNILEQLKAYYINNPGIGNPKIMQAYINLLKNFSRSFSSFSSRNSNHKRHHIMVNIYLALFTMLKSEYIHMLQLNAYKKNIEPSIENVPHEIKQDLLLTSQNQSDYNH